jgi:hypothetical protein
MTNISAPKNKALQWEAKTDKTGRRNKHMDN